MSIAWLSGLIILVILIIMLIAGAPIAISLAVSSICAILPVLSTEPALITGAQRIFSGISVFNLIAIPFFILAGNIMNKGCLLYTSQVQEAFIRLNLLRQYKICMV